MTEPKPSPSATIINVPTDSALPAVMTIQNAICLALSKGFNKLSKSQQDAVQVVIEAQAAVLLASLT